MKQFMLPPYFLLILSTGRKGRELSRIVDSPYCINKLVDILVVLTQCFVSPLSFTITITLSLSLGRLTPTPFRKTSSIVNLT